MHSPARPGRAPGGSLDVLWVALAAAGLGFWFLVGLPWAPHNETFDWIVQLESRSLRSTLFEQLPTVLSLRPLGTGPAWLLYRLGGHDVALVEVVNAVLAVLAWVWLARGARERRVFGTLALVVGGVFFAGYIWVFHLHGIFYGPLLLLVAGMARAARGPLDLRTVLGVFVGTLVVALAHPYALPLVVAFVIGAILETPRLRSREGLWAAAVVLSGTAAAYLLLVPGHNRGVVGDPIAGLVTSYRTLELNAVGSGLAGVLAAWTAARALPGAMGTAGALFTLLLAGAGVWAGLPVLPLWIAWAGLKCVRRGRWTLAALLAATALLPLPNPTGSPTYAIFAVFVAACITASDEHVLESRLAAWGPLPAAGALLALLGLAVALRSGLPVPVLSHLARPLFAEGERTRQFEVVVNELMKSPWRGAHARFLHPAANPTDVDATDRRFRPPTDDIHLKTWLDWKRGGPAAGADTLVLTFGGETAAGMDTVLLARGRYAGDALVLRRSSAAARPDTTGIQAD